MSDSYTRDGGEVDTDFNKTVFDNLGIDINDLDQYDDDFSDDSSDDDLRAQIPADDDFDPTEFNLNSDDTRQTQDDRQQQQQPRQQQEQPQQIDGRLQEDAQGNLVDSTGKVVAHAGAERRFYQDAQSAKARAGQIEQQFNQSQQQLQRAVGIAEDLNNRLTEMQQSIGFVANSGLEENELRMAMHFAQQYKQNPLQGLKLLLTQAASDGIDISSLGVDGGGIDVASITNTLRNELNTIVDPIKQQTEQQKQQQAEEQRRAQHYEDARQNVENFFRANPNAVPHADKIDKLLKDPRFSNLTLNEAWLNIQLYLQSQQNAQRSQQRTNPQNTNQRSRMSGHPPSNTNRPGEDTFLNSVASVDDDYDKILNDVMDHFNVT